MSSLLVKKCPNCDNQFPISFKKCIYCKTDLGNVKPTEHIPLGVPPQSLIGSAKT